MRIRHSKYKNTGLIFELLVKQITADTLERKDSPALQILKKFYAGKSPLGKEYKLYEFVMKNNKVPQAKAESILSSVIDISKTVNEESLKKQKYELIKEIKAHYSIENFFSIKVENYTTLAALYCLLESYKMKDTPDIAAVVENKNTLLEHLTGISRKDINQNSDKLLEEYSNYDKDLRLLTFKILLEKFNSKYVDLLPEQKNILREFINSVDSSTKLRDLVNQEYVTIRKHITESSREIGDSITKIKLAEIIKTIAPIPKGKRVGDSQLVNLMQYYELVNELRSIKN